MKVEKSESGRKWIKGGGRRGHLKKLNKNKWKKVKLEESESREGVGTIAWRKEIKKWKWGKVRREPAQRVSTVTLKNESEKGDKIKMVESERGERKYWNYQTEISQWKSESKSVKSTSENSVSKWKVPLETLDLGAEQELPLDEKWKSVRRNKSEAIWGFELYQPVQIVPSEYCLLESQRI